MSDSDKPLRRYLDVPGVAAFLGLTEHSVRKYVQRGKIPHRKLCGKLLFDPEEIERWFGTLPGVTPHQARRAS